MKAHIIAGAATGALALGLTALGALALPSGASAQNRPAPGTFADLMTNPGGGGSLLLQPTIGDRGDLFKGCENDEQPPIFGNARANPRSRIENARGGNSSGNGRVFAQVGAEEQTEAPISDPVEECWSRIDGLWVEIGARPTFDTEFRAAGWGGLNGNSGQSPMAHSVYTKPRYLMIEKTINLQHQLIASQPFGAGPKTTFLSNDGINLKETLSQRGPNKRYRASRTMRGLGRDLSVRVASNGAAVLTIGNTQFVRPRPALSEAQRAAQPPMQDVFNRGDNIQDLDVVAQGYDVTKQNPNRFGENNKRFVFEKKTSTDYYAKDRKIVPIDMALDLHGDQEAIYFSSIVSSASEIQSAYASSFGISGKVGISGTASDPTQTASVNLEASVGYGADFANSEFSSIESSQSVSQAVGFSRHRKFALIRDHAQSELDGFFRDAVILAVKSGDFSQIIHNYGTHYPYATTFGSSGQMRHTTTEEGYREVVAEASSESKSGGAKVLIVEAEANSSKSSQNSRSFQRKTQYGTAFFDAVGGNGSWDQNGFSAGETPYPILMDMRPLSELLNPINFPGQPMIYNQGRRQLAAAIDDYLQRAGRNVNDRSLLPEIIPTQKWTMRALSLNCHSSGSGEGNRPDIQLKGSMRLDLKYGRERSRVVFNVTSKKGYRKITCDGTNHTATDATKYTIEGTAQEIMQAAWRVRANFDEVDFGSPIKAFRTYTQGGMATDLRPDKIYQGSSAWNSFPNYTSPQRVVGEYRVPQGPGQPDLRLRIEWERVE